MRGGLADPQAAVFQEATLDEREQNRTRDANSGLAETDAQGPVVFRTMDASGGSRTAVVALRIGLGLIWAINLVFVVDPANQFFSTFQSTAQSFSPTTVGGVGLPQFASHRPELFAPLVAGVTAYLAVALSAGITARLACVIGFGFNAALLLTQLGGVWIMPGGTDVGPQPLYLLLYVGLYLGDAGRTHSLEAYLCRRLGLKRRWLSPLRLA